MAEAVTMSLQHLPKEDLHAIVSYLRTIKPQPDPVQDRPAFSYGEEAHDEDAVRGAAPSNSQTLVQDGKVLYSGYCASCHQSSGSGTPDQGYPSLFHNTATGRANADNLVTAILVGVQRESGEGEVFMPRFDGESYVQSLTDEQIAAISNYVLKTFGNGKVSVTVDHVKVLRAGGTPSPIIAYAGLAMPALVAAGLIVLVMCVGLIGRLRRRSNSPSP
jgi:mono/diheme cytochrome c family protein